jgi:23S rRNA maturation-related 3'-5' exoribonuclease YhaM
MDVPYPDKSDAIRSIGATFGADVSRMTEFVLGYPSFSVAASALKHHNTDGGLQFHTWEVITLCLMAGRFYKLDLTTLYLAALFHDTGKTYDNGKVGGVWKRVKHERDIGHLVRSGMIWEQAVRELNLFKDREYDVLHLILSHHAEHGSPVLPNSKMAWVLSNCDGISAMVEQIDGTNTLLG